MMRRLLSHCQPGFKEIEYLMYAYGESIYHSSDGKTQKDRHSRAGRNPAEHRMPVEDPVFSGDQVRHDGVGYLVARLYDFFKNDGAQRLPLIFNLQSSIFIC